MSKTKMISAKAGIKEFMRILKYEGSIDKQDLIAFTNDASERFSTDQQLAHKVTLLYVKDYRVELPPDFLYVCQAAYRLDSPNSKPSCTSREEISQWVEPVLGANCEGKCELEINLNCPSCNSKSCTCGSPIVEVDVDRLWLTSNPQFSHAYRKHFYSYGGNTERKTCFYHPEFRLMRYSTNNFFNVDYHISGCLNLNLDHKIEYTIDHPNLIVNFKEGEILLSYLGVKLDEEGYRLIPNHPTAIRALGYALAERVAFHEYYRDGKKQNDRIFWQQMVEMTEKWTARARSQLQMPDFDEFHEFVRTKWHRIIPDYHWWEDLERGRGDSFHYPDQTYLQKGYDHTHPLNKHG